MFFVTFAGGESTSITSGKEMGYCDGDNGVMLRYSGGRLSIVLKSKTNYGDEEVFQEDWNIDTLSPSVRNPSKITLDISKTQILVGQMQALYVGAVTIGFDIDGVIVPVHIFKHANLTTEPYIQQASLPIRYRVWSNGNNPEVKLNAICSSVIVVHARTNFLESSLDRPTFR